MISLSILPLLLSTQKTLPSHLIWKQKAFSYQILWKTNLLSIRPLNGGDPVFEAKDTGQSLEDRGVENENQGEVWEQYSILSVVGPLVSIQSQSYLLQGNGIGSSSTNRFESFDLSKEGAKADLRNYFPETDLIAALNSEKTIDSALNRHNLQKPKSTQQLVDILSGIDGEDEAFDPDLFHHFAFHHIEGDLVAVRMSGWLGKYGFNSGTLKQIGILLPIPAALKSYLLAASKVRDSFLMKDRYKIDKGIPCRW